MKEDGFYRTRLFAAFLWLGDKFEKLRFVRLKWYGYMIFYALLRYPVIVKMRLFSGRHFESRALPLWSAQAEPPGYSTSLAMISYILMRW
ncbi:MAG: hypothetical protein HFG05_07585 [Oscillibacter sp.]|nr:hypothetical protein [Oscillibacter sp.]